jgi:hypothetical protein
VIEKFGENARSAADLVGWPLLSDRWAGMQIWSLCVLTHADVGASP